MPRIRITGVVKAMNRAREQLSAGIPEAEKADFRASVQSSITQIETICREHRTTPDALPAPSRRAYQYLKSIDLDNLPERLANAPPPPKKIRISNLIAGVNTLHADMSELVKRPGRDNIRLALSNEAVAKMLADIQQRTARVEEICQQKGAHPADLPNPSRNAYAWLKFLSVPENFRTHLLALSIAHQEARQANCRKKRPAERRQTPLHIQFYNIPHLYRFQERQDGIHLTAHEALIHAPRAVLKALVCAALLGKETTYAQRVNDFATTEEFDEYTLALAIMVEVAEISTRGHHYDLADLFQRLNNQYFAGKLSLPNLHWNKTLTHRKMGHYQPATDTILISLTLDSPTVPAYVIEFVMYHEMLHKKLGIQKINGRRYAHTPAFRAAERKFARYAEANAFLNQLGQALASGSR